MEDRIQRAVELFRQGYNCSQSVCAAFADEYGYTFEQALRMSASFGGGIGRMRMTCGAACGMFILAGLETGCVEGKDREGKEANYRLVQQLAEKFVKPQESGSIRCLKPGHPNIIKNVLVSKQWKKQPEFGWNIYKMKNQK